MGEWTLNVGNVKVVFLTTNQGVLGVKFNSSKESGKNKVLAPGYTTKEIPKFNPKLDQEMFYDTRYGDNHLRSSEAVKKYFEKSAPEVFLTKEEMAKMFPLSKEAKAISKQPLSKLNMTNVGFASGYYLLPKKDYENIQRYKKLVEYLGDDFIITTPMRLRVTSTKEHNYAIFVNKKQNAVVMLEVLVKAGKQPIPAI